MGVSHEYRYIICSSKWREEQAKMLKEKDDEELTAISELRAAAQKELTDWYNHYEDTLKHAKDANK